MSKAHNRHKWKYLESHNLVQLIYANKKVEAIYKDANRL